MSKLKANGVSPNVNVTLGQRARELKALEGKELPCTLCGEGLPILISKVNKPYCVCNRCGIQIFFRGKPGILRLFNLAAKNILVTATEHSAAHAIQLLNRLELLNLQKDELKTKQGIIFQDKNVENAIQTVDAEIERVQGELANCAGQNSNQDTNE